MSTTRSERSLTEPAGPSSTGYDAHAVNRRLAPLTGDEREVIILTSYFGYTTQEAAVALRLSEEMVEARISSGLRRLADNATTSTRALTVLR